MTPLRIGIACYPTYGGSGVLATELGLALADRGHEVHLFSYARPSRLSSFHQGLEFHNVAVSSYPLFQYPPYDLALASAMREVMEERSLDVMHVHYAVPHSICAWLARQMCGHCSTRIVTTLHGTDITILGRDPSYRDVIRFGLEHSDAVVCVSDWLEVQTRETFAFDGPIHVLPNFVDPRRFRPQKDRSVRAELGGDGRPLMVHMSNFRPLKRAMDTLAILELLAPHSEALLLLVGDGPDLTRIRQAALQRGLSHRVRFLGRIDDVEPIIAASDVALYPSESESFGLAALEAMSCSVPVVASDVGGLPEVIRHGETGFLRHVGDVTGMAEDVRRLLGDRVLATRMGAAGLARARKRFSLERVLNMHERLYKDTGATVLS